MAILSFEGFKSSHILYYTLLEIGKIKVSAPFVFFALLGGFEQKSNGADTFEGGNVIL